MATNQEAQTLEETLNKTDLGHVINENKKSIIIGGIILVLLIIGYSIFDQMQTSNKFEKMDRIFTVEQTVFKPFIEGKTSAIDFKKKLGDINNELVAEPNLVPALIESINLLDQKGEVDEATITIANNWLQKLSTTSSIYLFLGLRMAALYEDAGSLDESIKTLEGMVAHKNTMFKDRIHFDLVRLYTKKGDTAKANERYEFLQKNYEKSEFTRLSKMFLSGL